MNYEQKSLLQTPNVKTNSIGANSLISGGAHLWNTLPDDVKMLNQLPYLIGKRMERG